MDNPNVMEFPRVFQANFFWRRGTVVSALDLCMKVRGSNPTAGALYFFIFYFYFYFYFSKVLMT
jgi:hypothetical protein